jgi:hypothetical protein
MSFIDKHVRHDKYERKSQPEISHEEEKVVQKG